MIQMNAQDDRQANLDKAESLMTEAVRAGAELLVLPENFSFFGASEADKLAHREDPENGPSLAMLRGFAQKHRVWIVGGSIAVDVGEADRVGNTCYVVDDAGQVAARYDKIHLFDVNLGRSGAYRESDIIRAGVDPVVVATPFGVVGLTICYDLRFPELYRRLAQMGATIFTVPSAFTQETGQAHWELLLRARAVENFGYVLAPGQWGKHPGGRRTYGHSLTVEPWGTVTARCPDGAGFVLTQIDPAAVLKRRQQIPCLSHRVIG
ncbi:putative nitrilase/cyanide hydratase and apolipoprotein N-acyltransferase [Magnetofaba australis IT-1]|uniref:Putative nitrilase/cyanide hydratase and apolipoprotein N-acyltransferase n=1 Tax=Magnetofaba australis IT-1 TaxID=1434232 RepID=A0A1Y2K2I0_9PROT|nr:putative nitrilase/cyanide hydratase and apolipoprotein N-acyltransferase [Magnetofaba australis IT-1]